MKHELKPSECGDQFFVMFDDEIVRVFISKKKAATEVARLNKLSKISIVKKGAKNG